MYMTIWEGGFPPNVQKFNHFLVLGFPLCIKVFWYNGITWLLNSMQITSPDPILGTYIAHNPWLWLAWHIFLLRECAVLSFYAWVLNNHPSSGMNVELYNFTYLTFFPKYLCHLLMQVSLLLAFPIKLFYQIDSNHSLAFYKLFSIQIESGGRDIRNPSFRRKRMFIPPTLPAPIIRTVRG